MSKCRFKKAAVILLLICFVFSGCNRLNSEANKALRLKDSETHHISDEIDPDDSKDGKMGEDVIGAKTDLPDNNQPQYDYKKYTRFLNINENVAKLIKEDIDLDGNQEIIIAFGDENNLDGRGSLDIYVLREQGEVPQLIGHIDTGGYYTYDVNLVQMRGSRQKYIETLVTNGATLVGFELYKVRDNELITIEYSASATGSGNDALTSSANDGVYDGYEQIRCSYDVMYFNVCRYYVWNGESFEHDSTLVDTGDYPDNPEQVVDQFLRLNMLGEEDKNSIDVLNRLNQLNISQKQLDMEKIFSIAPVEWLTDLQIGLVEYDTWEKDALALVKVIIPGYELEFPLEKNNDRWQISDIEGDFAIKKK